MGLGQKRQQQFEREDVVVVSDHVQDADHGDYYQEAMDMKLGSLVVDSHKRENRKLQVW